MTLVAKTTLISTAVFLICCSIVPTSSASAASFCYENDRHSKASSHRNGVVVVHVDVSWSSLHNCSGERIGIKVYSYSLSYSGGVNGDGRNKSRHGIKATAVLYYHVGECCGIAVASDSGNTVSNYPRFTSASNPNGVEVYSKRDKEGVNRSFAETSIGADLALPYNDFPFGPDFRTFYNLVGNTWNDRANL